MNAAMSELSADLKRKASEWCKNDSWNRSLLWQNVTSLDETAAMSW